ncbi:hypothetical protein JHK87_006349 [Glycine soja]|nr:hypothetical protein JHK87_006349 [Glycine soja]
MCKSSACHYVENLSNGSALEVLPTAKNGVWRVKLLIDPRQLDSRTIWTARSMCRANKKMIEPLLLGRRKRNGDSNTNSLDATTSSPKLHFSPAMHFPNKYSTWHLNFRPVLAGCGHMQVGLDHALFPLPSVSLTQLPLKEEKE